MGRGRAPCCEKIGLNRGSWTPEEDLRLIAYIRKYGHQNWRALPKQAGLLRCGKSCRLRWINYLRPDIKRGNFTGKEEETLIKLHGLLGNKWSKIASFMPGRTDNEIKNVWNTHLKKRVAPKEPKNPSPTTSPPPPSAAASGDEQYERSTASVPLCPEGDNNVKPMNPSTVLEEKTETNVSNMDIWGMLEDSLSTQKAASTTIRNVSLSSSSSSMDSGATSYTEDMDLLILGEIPDIPIEAELWSAIDEVPGPISSETVAMEEFSKDDHHGRPRDGESRSWLVDLEKELDLWEETEEGGQSFGWWSEMEGEDPVSSYFQMRSTSFGFA